MNWNEKKMYSNRLKRDFFFSILFIEATMQISQDHTMQPEVHCFEVVLFCSPSLTRLQLSLLKYRSRFGTNRN